MTRPGARVRSIASRLFEPATMERIVDPILADLQCEYGEARARGPRWRARLCLVRGYLGLGSALIRLGIRHAADPRTGNPGAHIARTWIVALLACATLTVAFTLPPLLGGPWWKHGPAFGALLSVTLVPQALPLSIPAGVCIGVLWAARGRAATRKRLGAVLAIAVASTVVVWIAMEWAMPQANQRFREMVAARLSADGRVPRLEPGLNELGLSRLGQRSDPAAVRQYHLLSALCAAAIPLSLLAFALARHVRRAVSAVSLAMALSIAYVACMWMLAASRSSPLVPPVVQAWMPNTVFLLAACALILRGRRPGAV